MEEWRGVEGFASYQVSSHGRVRHIDKPNESRSFGINHRGFPTLVLYGQGGERYLRQVNKLVADAFLPRPRSSKMNSVWHVDGNFENCMADNLRWDMRTRVLEWNEMHRTHEPQFKTSRVRDNRTGRVYANAFECALNVGDVESAVVVHIERYRGPYEGNAKYVYI